MNLEDSIRDIPIPAAAVRLNDDQIWEILDTNPAFRGALGVTSAGRQERLDSHFQIPPGELPDELSAEPFQLKTLSRTTVGDSVPVVLSFSAAVSSDTNLRLVYVQAADRSALGLASIRDREQLRVSEQRYRALFTDNVDAVITSDCAGNFLHANPAFERLIGIDLRDLDGTHYLPLVVPELREYTKSQFERAANGYTVEYKTRITNAERNEIELHVTLIPVVIDGEVREVHCVAKDITAIEKVNSELERMAFTHPLTGLPNRNALDEYLAKMVEVGEMFSLLNINVDRLKAVNDRYGRNAGDDLLKAVAGRFNGFVNAPTKLFQYSGDNFMIVHRHDEDSEAFTFASAVEKLLRAPFVVGGQDLIISASIGVCVFPQYGYDRDSLIRRSEDAMLEAKRPGRSHITFFRELASDEDSRLLRLEFALRHALTNEELSIVYQPQVAVNTGEVHGAEALLRWNHPELGPISPAEFIPIAERSGLIHEIGMWVIENACQQLRTWHHLGHANLRLAVNASIDQFYDAEFYERLERAIQVSGIDPESLVIEVTESIAANADTVVEQLQRLKSLGVSIALDDFGTGYSSLQYLRSFPVDYLKIDRSFTSGLGSNDTDHNLVATVIDLARSFGLYTIAEGVETGEQLRILHELGAPLAQGFHISRPISPDEFGVWIDQYSA